MIKCSYLGTLGLILEYIGVYFGSNTWYGASAILIGALMFIMSYSFGIDKEIELINRIKELEKRVNQKEDKNESTEHYDASNNL